jgi:hypothetical protein
LVKVVRLGWKGQARRSVTEDDGALSYRFGSLEFGNEEG